MGKFSRSKGIRNELKFRDEMIKLGYQSRRIPLSGSQEGFKGDVVFEKAGKTFKAEVKSRKNSFKVLYDYLYNCGNTSCILGEKEGLLILARISINNLEYVLYDDSMFSRVIQKDCTKFYKKVLKLKELLGESDILAIKDDRMPFIYIRYL